MIFEFQSIIALYHSPKTESCPRQNYQDEQIHGNYNHQESLLQIQRNHYSLPKNKKNEVMTELSKINKLWSTDTPRGCCIHVDHLGDMQHAVDSWGHDMPCGVSIKILLPLPQNGWQFWRFLLSQSYCPFSNVKGTKQLIFHNCPFLTT